jgi:hypothetical protein
MADHEFGRWCPKPTDVANPTPLKVRSLMIECFFEAQRATMMQAGQAMGTKTDEETLRRNVEGVVRMAFKETGGDFNSPTKSDFENVLDVLARKAGAWGTPRDIVDHHKKTMVEIIGLLP